MVRIPYRICGLALSLEGSHNSHYLCMPCPCRCVVQLPPLVEEAEVCYRAQLLHLQPAQPKLAASAAQLRARLASYPSELVRQVQALVERHGVEACQVGSSAGGSAPLVAR